MEKKEAFKVLTEEEIACVTGGLERNKYMSELTKIKKMYDEGIINFEQFSEIERNARNLSEEEYKEWKLKFKDLHGFSWN